MPDTAPEEPKKHRFESCHHIGSHVEVVDGDPVWVEHNYVSHLDGTIEDKLADKDGLEQARAAAMATRLDKRASFVRVLCAQAVKTGCSGCGQSYLHVHEDPAYRTDTVDVNGVLMDEFRRYFKVYCPKCGKQFDLDSVVDASCILTL